MKSRKLLCWWVLSVLLTISVSVYATESDRLFSIHDASEGLADNGAQVIICTKTGRMVISSIGHINFYNGSSFDHIDAHTENIYELPKYEGHYHLYFDKDHHLWVKDKYQVTCVDLMTERFIEDVQGVFKKMGFNDKAEDLFVDEDGSMLLLSKDKLYNCKTKKSFPVRKGKKLQDIGKYKEQFLLFYDDSSIEAFNLSTGKMEYIKTLLDTHKAEKYKKSSVVLVNDHGFYQIRNGEREGILLDIDAVSGESKVLLEPSYHLNNLAIKDNVLYVASQYGYWTYDISTGEKQHYQTLMSTNYQEINTDINDIAFDLQGGMWMGTEKQGLLYSKPFNSPFKVLKWDDPMAKKYATMLTQEFLKKQETLPRRVNCAFHDSRGWTWHGTYVGLKRYLSDKDNHPLIINNEDGLKNNVIHSIIEDNDHNLWVSTSNGISCLVIRNDSLVRVVSFNEDDNIPTKSFVNGLAMKLEDGSIIMQTLDFIVKFDPSSFHTTRKTDIKLYPKLIRLMVNGRTIQPGMEIDGKEILDRVITRAQEINVDYDQNNISLLFSGLNYFRPTQTFYRVRVKGFRNEWTIFSLHDGSGRVDNQGMLHYSMYGIPPGKYEIEVQASMSPNEWMVDPFVWRLSVNEPWWRMTFVYLTLGLLLLGLLIANFIFYNRNTRMKLNRANIEGSVIKRIRNFVNMCNNMEKEMLTPYTSDIDNTLENAEGSAFADAMMKIVPYVTSQQQNVSMKILAKEAQMNINEFYEMMSSNLYKNPHAVVMRIRLQHAAEMLLNSDKSIDEIAEELHFSSTNFLIASFYHQYRQTPQDYRVSNPR